MWRATVSSDGVTWRNLASRSEPPDLVRPHRTLRLYSLPPSSYTKTLARASPSINSGSNMFAPDVWTILCKFYTQRNLTMRSSERSSPLRVSTTHNPPHRISHSIRSNASQQTREVQHTSDFEPHELKEALGYPRQTTLYSRPTCIQVYSLTSSLWCIMRQEFLDESFKEPRTDNQSLSNERCQDRDVCRI